MKPDWDKLMKKWNSGDRFKTSLVADVDCTDAGKSLCDEVGVEGFPTLKWGDPSALEDYDGGRDYKELEKFAEENLKPLCSPSNLHLCSEEKKKEISELQAMSEEELAAKIKEKEEILKSAEETFEAEVEKLQSRYEELEKAKNDKVAEVKASGLGLMKTVLGHLKTSAKGEEL